MPNNINEFLKWAVQKGTVISPKIEFKNTDTDGVGAFWKEDCVSSEPESLIQIPRDIILTVEDAIESFNSLGQGDFNSVAENCPNVNAILKLYLAFQRTSGNIDTSPYKEYISLLPKMNELNTPYCWNPELKSYIRGTNLGNSLRSNTDQLVEEWWQLINALPEEMKKPEEHYINMKFYYEYSFHNDEDLYNYFVIDSKIDNWTSFPNYLWASIMLKSRSFPAYLLQDSERNRKQDEAMLLPVIDLLNHSPKAKVDWSVVNLEDKQFFEIKLESGIKGSQVFNNYGMKGNEELLLAYGFCLEDNYADSAALKIKIPMSILEEIVRQGIKLPHISDYTTSVAVKETDNVDREDLSQYEDGLLFFITKDHIPENLVKIFQMLVKNTWENKISLRMELAGLNKLRKAFEKKLEMIPDMGSDNMNDVNKRNIRIYTKSQKDIFNCAIKTIKRTEKDILKDPVNKPNLLSLKLVYKRDIRLQNALLISLGVTSYDMVIESEFQDHYWLLFLIRCYNRSEYINQTEGDNEDEQDGNYLPEWIEKVFKKILDANETLPKAAELEFSEVYESLIPPLSKTVPEIFGRGKWTVREFVLAGTLLNRIGFTRGKEEECILVKGDY